MICLNLPVNRTSFGQVSSLFLREAHSSKLDCLFHPIGETDISQQTDFGETAKWLSSVESRFWAGHSRSNPTFKLWHINGSLSSVSKEQFLFTFHETDELTEVEYNILKNQDKVFVSSEFTSALFKASGINNVYYVPLAFDEYNFQRKFKKYFSDDRIVFSVVGKLERRKNHEKIIKSWIKKFGNNRKYFLYCAVYNPFLVTHHEGRIIDHNGGNINHILGGEKPFNIEFYPYIDSNEKYNEFLNCSNIVVGMSGGEGWGLPEFQSVAMGKYGVILNCAGYKGWADSENSILVEPSGKRTCVDGVFFKPNDSFNKGNIFDFNEDDFISACELAIKKVEANRVNDAGLKLREKFTSKNFYNSIAGHF